MSTLLTQVGTATESTYGTSVTPTKFWEFNSEGVKLAMNRVVSSGLRSGRRVAGSNQHQSIKVGAGGPFTIDVPTKGFGFWLVHMLGTVATTGPVDLNYTHTGTVGSLLGDSFTWQINRPFNPSGTAQAFTYEGGKIASWELACDVNGILQFTATMDFEDESTVTALATAVYPAGANVFTWAQGAITIGGAAAEISTFRVGGNNALKTDRFYQRNSALKKEPVENGLREFTWSLGTDFTDLTQYNRFRDAVNTNNEAAVVATYQGPVAHAGTTLPSLVTTIPAARFDAADVNIGGPDALTIALSGIATDNASASPVSIAFTSTDVTP